MYDCYEYSCIECGSPESGHCTKCSNGWTLKDGNCYKCKSGYNNAIENKCVLDCQNRYCLKCSIKENNIFCEECKSGSRLVNGKCIKCEDKYCLSCSDNENICTECQINYKVYNGQCASNFFCGVENKYCKYCINFSECIECEKGYEVNPKGICMIKRKIVIFFLCIIFSALFIIFIIMYIIYKKCKCKKKRRMNQNRNRHINININNNVNLYIRNQYTTNSMRNNILLEKELTDEFNEQRIKFEKDMLCQICHKNKGKYISDCGCIICQIHSNFKISEKTNEKNKICFNCGKLIKDLSLIKNNCNICLQETESVCHFKCGCALKVCEECFIKCKKLDKKCPGCRGNI